MPTYDYECTECKHRFEMFQSIKDDPIEKCLKCGGKVKKLIGGGVGIIFKGSGFYVNDYKKGGGKKHEAISDHLSTHKSTD
jgi:putative FmdB family regulatory protein